MTEQDCFEFSYLFSMNYGRWGNTAPEQRRGKRIKLPTTYYQKLIGMDDMYVSYCHEDGILIGACFFLKKEIANDQTCVWITQLVVDSRYRKHGIAKRLLQSAWGFSDYGAWGLATANSITIKTLESVTWRKVDPTVISDHLDVIRDLCDSLPYRTDGISLKENESFIDTSFPIEREKHASIDEIYIEKLGNLPEGYEWLAFTFQSQPMLFDQRRFDELLTFSAEQLNDAYSRMDMDKQPWTRGTAREIDAVLKLAEFAPGSRLLDVGCGQGRHSIELARRGFKVTGIDASQMNIAKACGKAGETPVEFKCWDARRRLPGKAFDCAICLYDVIGSYRTLEENVALIHQLHNKLRKGGRAVISVMNMKHSMLRAQFRGDVEQHPDLLFKLEASSNMQARGDMFDKRFLLLDESKHLVFHKEQFEQDGLLSAEYVIADYRFTQTELKAILEEQGFNVLDSRFVQAGHFDIPLPEEDDKAKEILIVIEKR